MESIIIFNFGISSKNDGKKSQPLKCCQRKFIRRKLKMVKTHEEFLKKNREQNKIDIAYNTEASRHLGYAATG